METNNKILREFINICPTLVQSNNNNPYVVSVKYFDSLAEIVTQKIKADFEVEYYFTTENPYSIPTGYFEDLPATIVQKIAKQSKQAEVLEEMQEISPLISKISRKPIYSVPDDYFKAIDWSKTDRVSSKAPIVPFPVSRRITAYAVAALVIGLIAIGIFLFTGKQDTKSQANNQKPVFEVKKLSEKEIVEFLKSSSVAERTVTNHNIGTKKDSEIKSIVSEISDDEIQRFLEETGEQDEM